MTFVIPLLIGHGGYVEIPRGWRAKARRSDMGEGANRVARRTDMGENIVADGFSRHC